MAVRDAAPVRVLDGVGDARHDVSGFGNARTEALGQQFAEQPAVDLFQREIADVAQAPGIEHGHDVGVVQPARCLGLPHERLIDAVVPGGVLPRGRPQLHRLHDDFAVQHRIEGEVGRRVPLPPQFPEDRVAAEQLEVVFQCFCHGGA
jgi:hypothetical protein